MNTISQMKAKFKVGSDVSLTYRFSGPARLIWTGPYNYRWSPVHNGKHNDIWTMNKLVQSIYCTLKSYMLGELWAADEKTEILNIILSSFELKLQEQFELVNLCL